MSGSTVGLCDGCGDTWENHADPQGDPTAPEPCLVPSCLCLEYTNEADNATGLGDAMRVRAKEEGRYGN